MAGLWITISALSFILAIVLYIKGTSQLHLSRRIAFSLFSLFTGLSFIFYFVSDYFTGEGITQAVFYHLQFGIEGADITSHIPMILVGSLVIGGLFFLFGYIIFKFPTTHINISKNTQRAIVSLLLVAIVLSLLSNPLIQYTHAILQRETTIFFNQEDSDFYNYYKEPTLERTDTPKNLVFIYAEGLEHTYFNETLFPNLVSQLKEQQKDAITFTDIRSLEASSWTMGGMVTSQCGIPLLTYSHGNSMGGIDSFLPAATCITDLLKEEGYDISFLGGANLSFAGKKKFLETHSFDSIRGKKEWINRYGNTIPYNEWGLHDDTLMNESYDRFLEKSKQSDPFALFLLTLDTHPPHGFLSPSCNTTYTKKNNAMLDAVKCTDQQISNLIESIKSSPYANETTIVLVSDHLAQKNTATSLLEKTPNRRNLFMILPPNNNSHKNVTNTGSQLDIFPSLLPYLGFNGSLGLGRDLQSKDYSPEETFFIQNNYYLWENDIFNFWSFPVIDEFLGILPDQEKIMINEREFRIPTLLELDDELKTRPKFDFDDCCGKRSLHTHVSKMDDDTRFVWIDYCSEFKNNANANVTNSTYCVMLGKGGISHKIIPLDGPRKISTEEIRSQTDPLPFEVKRIAHAAGIYENITNTNSLEALSHNYDKGFRYFELDFHFTSDNRIVCMHDWNQDLTRTFQLKTQERLSYEEFNEHVKMHPLYTRCTLKNLSDWLSTHPDARIITDFKEHNKKGLLLLTRLLPTQQKQFIPQVYNPDNLESILEMGYDHIIWTLYRFSGTNEIVVDQIKKQGNISAVTMPLERAQSRLPTELKQLDIPTYTHTINDPARAKTLLEEYNITEIYTDTLLPK